MSATRLTFNRFGLAENPIGLFVKLPFSGRVLLGEVISCRHDPLLSVAVLTVKHFCGDPWPIEPAASAVEVISQSAQL